MQNGIIPAEHAEPGEQRTASAENAAKRWKVDAGAPSAKSAYTSTLSIGYWRGAPERWVRKWLTT